MRDSNDPTLGINRTGMQISPAHARAMLEGTQLLETDTDAEIVDDQGLSATRLEYIAEADPIGSLPPPATPTVIAQRGGKMLTARRPQAFIDKLAERLAFERGGTRLYDAVLAKVVAYNDSSRVSVDEVQSIRDSEARHALLIKECLETLGADPTAQTPSADLVGVETMGLLQVVSDPRTTLAQTLHAALTAELVDHEGWEDLMAMALEMGHEEMAKRFKAALDEEDGHLTQVRSWYALLTMEAADLA